MPSASPRWVEAKEGYVPVDQAVAGGVDIDGEPLYVGRAKHDGHIIPGKIRSSHGVCYVAYEGLEIPYRSYQVLTSTGFEFEWIHCKCGTPPMGVILGGRTADGTPMYIGRTVHEGSNVIGKVLGNSISFPFAGREIRSQSYEVLCLRDEVS
ncbi:uncharacterized protein LOC141850881 [Brevipalpus obovatus]|uniref:uncharacterized protein LOC141850881 n=1 Tax=Brevipalpus obovatus TaxID=246614 RepID=UPI003D9DFE66